MDSSSIQEIGNGGGRLVRHQHAGCYCLEGVRMREMYMNGRQDYARFYARSHDSAARLIALLSPYLFWGLVGCITGAIMLL